MTPLERQFALKKKGVTQHAIAEELGVQDISVSIVINGHRISDRIMRKIAERIGQDVKRVFPEYYLKAPKRRTSKVSKAA